MGSLERLRVCRHGLVIALLVSLAACSWFYWQHTRETESWLQQEEPDDALVRHALTPWHGDLDGMAERGMLRVLVAFNHTNYFLDKGKTQGVAWDMGKQYEQQLQRELGQNGKHLQLVFVPTTRDRLLDWLEEGRGDIAIANLTVTPERQRQADFSGPFISDASEVVITRRDTGPLRSLDDLAGRSVAVRLSSSYYRSLQALNKTLEDKGLPAVNVVPVDEQLEDDDVLELMNAGVYDTTIVDLHVARLWSQVFPSLELHADLAVATGNRIAWAVRKQSPLLLASVNAFMVEHCAGTAAGNDVLARYYGAGNGQSLRDVLQNDERARFGKMAGLFRRYAEEYNFNWLMLMAQAYQESGLDQHARNASGAVGVMQVLPATAAADPINIRQVDQLDNNIHAGIKYLRFITDHYFNDPDISPLDRHLFAFAAYNAGPARIQRLRELAEQQGLDPNRWFQHVEVVAARKLGSETTRYVANIYKYYITYRRLDEGANLREVLKAEARGDGYDVAAKKEIQP